jgi:hypothetical protein
VLWLGLIVTVVIWLLFILEDTNLLFVLFLLTIFAIFLISKVNRLRYDWCDTSLRIVFGLFLL